MHPNNRHIQTHNFAGFISFAEVGGGGGGGLIEEKPCEDVRNAATTSYSGDIVNHYTYQGRKLGKKVYNSQHTLTVDEAYYDELMLSFGVPSRISHADGYVVLDKHGAIDGHYFYLKDHLGNVRSVLTPDQNNQPTVVQANDYYPFGMSYSTAPGANKFMYNSKEEQEMPGKWLDYGARFYDAQIGRWHSVDPHAEAYSDISPYVYTANNPVLFVDPDGRDYGIRYDSESGTIVIYARYYVSKDDQQAIDLLSEALSQWNSQSINLRIDGIKYEVSFDLQVRASEFPEHETDNDYAGNVFGVMEGSDFENLYTRLGGRENPSQVGGFVITEQNGNKRSARVRNDMDSSVERAAHEIGHTLFLDDQNQPGSVMSTRVSTKQMVGVQNSDARNVARQAKQCVKAHTKGKPAQVGRSIRKE